MRNKAIYQGKRTKYFALFFPGSEVFNKEIDDLFKVSVIRRHHPFTSLGLLGFLQLQYSITILLISAKFCAELNLLQSSSSTYCTSSIQCRLFSMPQCARLYFMMVLASRPRLEMKQWFSSLLSPVLLIVRSM